MSYFIAHRNKKSAQFSATLYRIKRISTFGSKRETNTRIKIKKIGLILLLEITVAEFLIFRKSFNLCQRKFKKTKFLLQSFLMIWSSFFFFSCAFVWWSITYSTEKHPLKPEFFLNMIYNYMQIFNFNSHLKNLKLHEIWRKGTWVRSEDIIYEGRGVIHWVWRRTILLVPYVVCYSPINAISLRMFYLNMVWTIILV